MTNINQPHEHVKELLGFVSSLIREELQKSNGSGAGPAKNDFAIPEERNGKRIYAAVEAEVERPLDKLTKIFKLTELERDMLLLALAPAIDAAYLNTYETLNPMPGSHYLTPWIVKRILKLPLEREVELRKACKENGRLFLCGLLKNTEQKVNLMMRPLVIEERIVDYLLEDNDFDLRLENLLKPVDLELNGVEMIQSIAKQDVEQIVSSVEAAISGSKSVYMEGREDGARLDIAKKTALHEEKALLYLDMEEVKDRNLNAIESVRLAFREAALRDSVLFLDSFNGGNCPFDDTLILITDLSRDYSVRVLVSGDKNFPTKSKIIDMDSVRLPTY